MVNLEQYFKENAISKYSVMKHLGKKPSNMYHFLNRKLSGEQSISFADLKSICEFVTGQTGVELRPEQVAWEPKTVLLK